MNIYLILILYIIAVYTTIILCTFFQNKYFYGYESKENIVDIKNFFKEPKVNIAIILFSITIVWVYSL